MLAERSTVVESQLSPRNANPRNLRGGVLRGGRRPIDLYWRIHQGVAGSPMPAHGSPRPGISGTLTDEEIWQLADYVLAMVDSDRMPDETGSMATR
jgi:mono/diheme cytochrome c family protein